MSRIAFLMYHELELPQRPLCDTDPGYVRYVLPATVFQEHVDQLRSDRVRGLSTGAALTLEDDSRCVAITFDDGSETDLLGAAPVLLDAGFGATFYVTVEHLGRRGFLSRRQLRELAELGFEVGSHAMTHRYLHDLPTGEIRAELAESKRELEEITGGPVAHFSCPGGRWDRRVVQMAREAGYESLVTSAIGMNSHRSDRFRLSRIPVMRGMGAKEVSRLARGTGVTRRRAQSAVLNLAKKLMGNSTYDRLRSRVLRRDGVGR